ncbi:dienelactone hydrolase family protein [Corynebacterium sp. MSK150]|uniref:dienelactone hydrolase family protein n=1 Tax=Corynebacterium sp. MSK150 TaxID=3050209 RepID=UPI002550CDD5|nr:dienelactone hydrolase family protein [Corynebacterium sp. MSK150]MDK8524267.1 dienelactone hydrolase family protein [Corynebacterium sp. MSK150]
MSANLNKHLATLSKRGRNRVLVGDLDYAGVTGKVYTPAEGQSLPAVAFGHDWMHKIKDYHATLRHLASWGIVVVAPDSETGPFPNHRNLAADMESALQIAAGVKLGAGNITVSPGKLGMIGHGMGGGTAVLGALDNKKVAAVAAIYPSITAPSAVQAARRLNTPGLVIGAGQEDIFNAGNPAKLAHNWNGPVCFRAIDKGSHAGFTEDRLRKLAIGTAAFQSGPTEIARGLLTGFLLATLNGDSTYAAFADPEASAKKVTSLVGEDLAERAGVTRDA